MCGQRREVIGVVIHVMPDTGLGGAAMAAPVVGDDAIAVAEEEHHLRVPVIGRQGPAVAEDDGLTLAPVLVEDLNAVFGGDRTHGGISFALVTILDQLCPPVLSIRATFWTIGAFSFARCGHLRTARGTLHTRDFCSPSNRRSAGERKPNARN